MSLSFRLALRFLLLVSALLLTSPTHAWKMEAGKLSLSATSGLNQLQSHNFQQIYDTPPIVIALPTSAGGNASAVRVSNVTTTGFRMSSVEPNSEDGPHAAMSVSYIAIETGTHTFPDGEIIEAGILSTDKIQFNGNPNGRKQFETLNFTNSFTSPVLLSSIQTITNETGTIPRRPSVPWLTVAIDNITNNQADIALERSEVFDRQTGSNYQFDALGSSEDLAYVVMDRGLLGSFRASGNLLVNFETLYSENSVDGWSDGCDAINFAGSYSTPPIIVAHKSTRNEVDGGWLRECSVNSSQIQLTIDEDDAQDNERNHTNEDASLLIFSDPFFYDSNAATTLNTASNLMLESGLANISPSQFTTISFEQVYELPPAVFMLEDNQNPEPSSVRIRNITEQSFQVIPVEPDSRVADASDQTTTIHYMAITKGEFQFPDGKKIEIGPIVPPNKIINFQSKRLSGDSWFSFNFGSTFNSTPAFLSQIQSMNSEPSHIPGSPSQPWMTTAARGINAAGGSIALDRAETNTGTLSAAEEIAFLVTNPGIISDFIDAQGNTISAEAQATPDNVAGTRTCFSYNFLQSYPAPPLVVGSQMTWDGGDGGWLRRCSNSNSQVSIKIEEDWAADTDNAHTTERAGFLAFSESFHADFSLVANYQLEGPFWDGTSSEIIDSSNSGLNGRSVGNATAFPAKVCNGALFDGTGDYIEVADNPILDISDELTVMAWVKPSAFPASDLMTIVSKDTNFEFHIDPAGKILWWWNSSTGASRSFTSNNTNLSLGNWHHVAITYSKSQASQKIFIDGIETNSQSYANESLINNNLPLYIGTDDNYRSRDFNGSIDEVKIFKRALAINAIQKYAAETRPCASCILKRFDITQPTYALACPDSRAEIDITARCIDGSVKEDYTGTIDLSGPSGSSFFDSNVGGNAISSLSYSFSNKGNKKAYLYFNNEATDIKVTATDTAASVTSITSDDKDTDFKATGFKVTQQPSSFVCGKKTNMTMVAYGKTDNTPGKSCEVLTGFTGNKTMNAWFTATLDNNNTPSSNTTITLNNKQITEQNNANNDNLTLNFTNGESTFDVSYDNVAKFIDLNFNLDDAQYSQMSASTNAFVAYPENFLVAASSGTTNINGSTTHKAGQGFKLEITAQCKDDMGTLTTASHYKPNNDTSSIMTYLQRTGPIDGNSVAGDMFISIGKNLKSEQGAPIPASWETSGLGSSDFNNGVYGYTDASYSEVGSTRLYFKDINYFGEEVSQSSSDIGRFIPDYFKVTINSGSLASFCNIGSTPDFSYIGQPITYNQAPSLLIQAMNTNNMITQNYTEAGYLKMTPENKYISRAFPNTDTNNTGTDGVKLALSVSNQTPSSFTSANAGQITYTFRSDDTFTYTKNPESRVRPFDSDIEVEIDKIEDGDGVTSIPATFDITPSAIELRYGRWVMDNAFGPETESLTIPMRTEYWAGSNFATNESDHCSTYNATDMTLNPSLSGGSTSASKSGTLISGKAPSPPLGNQISLSAPGASNTGTVDLEFQVESWLQYDWDNDPLTPDTNPTSTASFGQYRGHDRIIYWREINE